MDNINDYEVVEPNASSIIESLRAIGYSLETAVADLIDNSITAGASSICIDSPFKGNDTKLFILDNGCGMDESTLKEAMKLGSSSPSDVRSTFDLGRFGLGLKTASFSQCKRLTVVTKHKGIISTRAWDLDLIISTNTWCLLKNVPQEYIDKVADLDSGTLVVWEKLDRVISSKDNRAESNFNNKKNILRRHLSLTFHRFIESGKLDIKIGGVSVTPWNPFLPNMYSSYKKELPPTQLGSISVKAWVMPHRNYFSNSEYKEAGFRKGWTPMQGFYIYRGDRLLTAGGWLGLKPDGTTMLQEHHYDLARICVDITNTDDFDWDIDIKKSKATPPDHLREQLGVIAKRVRKMAYDTYSYRGTKTPLTRGGIKSYIPLWNSVEERNGKLYYSVNSAHPYIQDILESLDNDQAQNVKQLIKLLSETLPVESISFEASKADRKMISPPYEDAPNEYNDIRQKLIDSLIKKGFSKEDAEEQVEIILNL